MNPNEAPTNFRFYDLQPTRADLRQTVLEGLQSRPWQLPPLLLYDERGSELFTRIVDQPEYYPPQIERSIFDIYHEEILSLLERPLTIIEPGAGDCSKARYLLKMHPEVSAYVVMDISGDHLHESARQLARDFPQVEVYALAVNFVEPFTWPDALLDRFSHTLIYYPGSSIGNFEREEVVRLLQLFQSWMRGKGGTLLGVDTYKRKEVLEQAYDDPAGYTAAFNLNLLERINRELDAGIDLSRFRHRAQFNVQKSRIEMHLVAEAAQTFRIDGQTFTIEAGDTIHTESSYKYTPEEFIRLSKLAHFREHRYWTDERQYFALYFFR